MPNIIIVYFNNKITFLFSTEKVDELDFTGKRVFL